MSKNEESKETKETQEQKTAEKQGKKPTMEEVLSKKVSQLTELAQRTQADYANYRKRTEEEAAKMKVYGKEDMLQTLIPFLDNFELAIKNKDNQEEFVKAMELMYAQLNEILAKEGVKPIESLGKKFDPYQHEALMTVEGPEDEIMEEFQRGYMMGDRVLRHSKVKVGKKK